MIGVDASRLTIGELISDYEFVGGRARSWHRKRALDRLSRERLPVALGRAVERNLGHTSAVYRIRRLEVDLTVTDRNLSDDAVVDALAARIARALSEEIRSGRAGRVARFESPGDYVAAFIERLAVGGAAGWEFDDFANLRHLAPREAIAEVFVSRPSYVADVARRLERGPGVYALVSALGEEGSERVLSAIASEARNEASAEMIRRLLSAAAARPAAAADVYSCWLERLLLSSLVEDSPERVREAAGAALAISRARRAVVRLDPAFRGRAAAVLVAGEPASGDLSEAAEFDLAPIRGALGESPLLAERLVEYLTEGADSPATERPAELGPADGAGRPDSPTEFRTPFAGLVLTLPVLRALGLPGHLGAFRLRDTLLALVEVRLRGLLLGDPLLEALVPATDPEVRASAPDPWPIPAAIQLRGLPSTAPAELRNARDADSYASLIAAHFAARLAGLGWSSLAYLRSQFLHRPGTVHVDERVMAVHLDPVPLSVVLRISGMTGDLGPMPWLERRLVVVLGES